MCAAFCTCGQKIERLKATLHFLDNKPQNTHTVFVDTEAEAVGFSGAEFLDTAPELVDRTFNRPRLETLEAAPVQVGCKPPWYPGCHVVLGHAVRDMLSLPPGML
jgi:hypothetical protein